MTAGRFFLTLEVRATTTDAQNGERRCPGTSSSAPFRAPVRWMHPLVAIAVESNQVLRDLGPDIQWVLSYVTDDKITCVYLAASEEIVREHGHCGGFPVDTVHQVRSIIDPTTVELIR